jgi:hypothetical protein
MKFSIRTVGAGLALLLPLAACSDASDAITSAKVLARPRHADIILGCSNVSFPFYTSVKAGSEPGYAPETAGILDTPCGYKIVTGIGGRVDGTSDFKGLQLRGRYVYPDGTMSAYGDNFYGTMPDGPEKFAEIPEGYAIVGVSMGESSYNVDVIQLRYRAVSVVNGQLQLTGPVYTASAGTATTDADYTRPLSDSTSVLVGAGFRSAVDKIKTMQLDFASLQ